MSTAAKPQTEPAAETDALPEGTVKKLAEALGFDAQAHAEGLEPFAQALAQASLSADEIARLNAELSGAGLSDASRETLKEKIRFDLLPEDKLKSLDALMSSNAASEAVAAEVASEATPQDTITHAEKEVSKPPVQQAEDKHHADAGSHPETQAPQRAAPDVTETLRQIEEEGQQEAQPVLDAYADQQEKHEALQQEAITLNETAQKKKTKVIFSQVIGVVSGAAAAFFATRDSSRWVKAGSVLAGLLGGGLIGSKLAQYFTLRPLQKQAEALGQREDEIFTTVQGLEAALTPIVEKTEARMTEVIQAQQNLEQVIAEQTAPQRSFSQQVRPEGIEQPASFEQREAQRETARANGAAGLSAA